MYKRQYYSQLKNTSFAASANGSVYIPKIKSLLTLYLIFLKSSEPVWLHSNQINTTTANYSGIDFKIKTRFKKIINFSVNPSLQWQLAQNITAVNFTNSTEAFVKVKDFQSKWTHQLISLGKATDVQQIINGYIAYEFKKSSLFVQFNNILNKKYFSQQYISPYSNTVSSLYLQPFQAIVGLHFML